MHKRRRPRAYQWKRHTVFLKEGNPEPADVDLDTVGWIPANHPFATTSVEIGEDLAQNNMYQQHGAPFRIQAEHDELHRKSGLCRGANNFERPYKLQARPNEK